MHHFKTWCTQSGRLKKLNLTDFRLILLDHTTNYRRKWRKIEEKLKKKNKGKKSAKKCSFHAHPVLRVWLRPWLLTLSMQMWCAIKGQWSLCHCQFEIIHTVHCIRIYFTLSQDTGCAVFYLIKRSSTTFCKVFIWLLTDDIALTRKNTAIIFDACSIWSRLRDIVCFQPKIVWYYIHSIKHADQFLGISGNWFV